jgi:four helix bundle protein
VAEALEATRGEKQETRNKKQETRITVAEALEATRSKRRETRIMAHNFLNLIVWQKSMELTDLIFLYSQGLPSSERFNLIDQMNRCSCSIPSNIAEGSGKRTKKHFAEYLSMSLSSSFELQTQLLICQRRNFGKKDILQNCLDLTSEVQKMLFSFKSLFKFYILELLWRIFSRNEAIFAVEIGYIRRKN